MTRTETSARMRGSWLSYIGAAYGALQAAGLCDLDFIETYGLSGMGAHFIVHEACSPSSVTVYNWLGDHALAPLLREARAREAATVSLVKAALGAQ